MSALLKQKAKVGVATKSRTSYDIADVFKRVKKPDGSYQNMPQEARDPEEMKEGHRVKKIVKPKVLEEYLQDPKK